MPPKKRSGTRSAASSTSRPPEPVVFFLDESLDAASICDALRDAGATVERSIAHFTKGTRDEVWLAEAGTNRWVVLTRDQKIRYRQLEIVALRAANVRTFVFTGGNVTLKGTAEILVRALPRLQRIAQANAGPFIYHIGRAGKPIKMA